MTSFTSPFTKPLIVKYVGEKNKIAIWELQESFEYHINTYPSEDIIFVNKGFQTDFASIPKILWNIFPPTGKYVKAAVIHDYLTSNKGKISLKDPLSESLIKYKEYTKKEVDLIFKEAMDVLDVSKFVKYIVWKSVSLFGNKEGYKE